MDSTRNDAKPLYRYRFGSAEFDEARFELKIDGQRVDMQRKPLEVLALLLAHGGRPVSSRELIERVWSGRPLVDNVVANAVQKLRRALEPAGENQILNQWGVGYRMAAPPRRTVIGLQVHSALALQPGMPVQHRPGLVLETIVGRSKHAEVWRAVAAPDQSGPARIIKFALDGDGIAALRREAGLAAVLRRELGPRSDLASVLASQLEHEPFFIERLDAGTDLARWASYGEHLATMAVPERLAFFRRICEAVAAAHRVGVIHRDLKPSNVLVAPAPADQGGWAVQVTDFGSGRVWPVANSAAGVPTQQNDLDISLNAADLGSGDALTLAYTAPELLRGAHANSTADVFALGLLLLQIVSADLRLSLASGWERRIDDRLLREDITRATDADPVRRFADAGALVAALSALPERRVQTARGNKAALRATIQKSLAQLHEVDAAVAEGRRAVAAALESSEPGSTQAVTAQLQLASDLARHSGWDECAALLDSVEDALDSDPAPREAERARLWWVRSDLLAYRLVLDASLAAAHRAMQHLESAKDATPDLADVVRARLGSALRMTGDYVASERIFRELVGSREARDGPDAESTQRARVQLARALMLQWRTDEAMSIACDATAKLSVALGEGNLITQQARDCIASIQFKREEYAAAADTYRGVVAALRQLSSRPTDFVATAQANVALALLHARSGAAAEREAELALKDALSLFAPDAPRVQSIRYQIAFARLDQGRVDGVAALLEGLDAKALRQANQADDWEGRIAFQRGRLALLGGRFDDAIAFLRHAESIVLRHAAPGALVSPVLVQRYLQLAQESTGNSPL